MTQDDSRWEILCFFGAFQVGVTSHSGVSSDNDCTFGNELSRRKQKRRSKHRTSCEMLRWSKSSRSCQCYTILPCLLKPQAHLNQPTYSVAIFEMSKPAISWKYHLKHLVIVWRRLPWTDQQVSTSFWLRAQQHCGVFAASKQTQVGYLPNDMIQVVNIWMKWFTPNGFWFRENDFG